MAKRKRDATARSRIRAYLAEHGPVRDDRGGATTALREAVAYQGSAVAFIQLITAMDEAGEIVREIRGKRTYGIAAAEQPAGAEPASGSVEKPPHGMAPPTRTVDLDIDYDELAKALLRQLAVALGSTQQQPEPGSVEEERTRDLMAERDRLQTERDDYLARLEASRRQLNALVALYVREDESESEESADVVRQALTQLRGADFPGAAERAS